LSLECRSGEELGITQTPNAPTQATKLALALAAKGVCEFAGCGAPLQVGGTLVGEVAHIHSPRRDGPRFNPQLDAAALHSLPNLMYLCGTHHPLIDKNPSTYAAEPLMAMKAKHEAGNFLVTAAVLQQLVTAIERPAVPEDWWDRPGAPEFRLNLASSRRPDGRWTFEATPMQIDGTDVGRFRYRWVLGEISPPFEPPDHLIKARHWQLKALNFTPQSGSLRLELAFWWEGAERTYAHVWPKESDFQSANVSVVRS
jgi:hypothetical protein